MTTYTYRTQIVRATKAQTIIDSYKGSERLISVCPFGSAEVWVMMVWETAHPDEAGRAVPTGPVPSAPGPVAASPKRSTAAQRGVAARLLGAAGGRARAKSTTPEERSAMSSLGGRAVAGKPRVRRKK